jgi:hypothetical protein
MKTKFSINKPIKQNISNNIVNDLNTQEELPVYSFSDESLFTDEQKREYDMFIAKTS